nr:reverse transcriptase domain-containing protein [Tanacetum cinerariifolium]
MQTQTSNTLHNAIMEAGGKHRPPMLAPGNYVHWKTRIKRYIDTKPNHEIIHYCLQNPPYKYKWVDKDVSVTKGSSEQQLKGIDNDIYSTVDAWPNACEMWKAIERLKQGESINVQDLETNLYWEFGKFTSRDGFDQTKTSQFPVIHPPPQETSIKILHDQENVINSVQTFLRKFNRYSFFETPNVLLLAWDRVFKIKDAFGNEQYKSEDIQELFRKLLNDVQNIHEELAEYINTPGWNRPAFYNNSDDDDVDYTIAITPVLSTKEPDNSLSLGDEHLDTISATKSDEVIKSSVEDLVLILSEFEGIPNTMCDVHLVNNPTPLEAKDHFEIVINSNDDYSSSDDDYLYKENIEYVEASPHDSELVTLRDNPTPSFEFLTKSSSTSLNSFLEETNTCDNSLPEFENFCFDLEEISSGSTTTHSDISLLNYEAFSFYDDHIEETSSGSTTTHYDISLSEYDSFIFDLSNDQFPPTDRSDFTHEEFADELAHIISPPEYDCFYFKDLLDPKKDKPPQDSDIRQLIREECGIEVSEEQKQNMENMILELVEICHQKELLCMHNNVDDLIESALNSKLLSINSQCLDNKEQEVKNVFSPVHAIAPILSTKEHEYLPSLGYEHSNTTSKTELDEIIKSGVEELLPILNENEDVEYVEASLPDPEIISVEEENLLSITRLIAYIESLNDNPTPDCVLNSFISIPIFEESDNSLSANFSPKFETFCDRTEETRSGNTTTHANDSLPEYDSFYFEIEPDQERLINIEKNNISDDSSNDPLLEEADLFLASDNLIPPGIENFADDSEVNIRFLEALLIDDSIPFPNNESSESDFDNPSIPRPPPEPPDAETSAVEEISVVNDELECLYPKNEFDTNHDYFPFMFVIQNFLPDLIYSKEFSFLLSAESEDTIFDPDDRTMAQMLQALIEGYEDTIVVPPINANNFELKPTLINLVQPNQFTGRQDPHNHLRFFNKVTSTFQHLEVPNTTVKLLLFPFSLEGEARIWLDKEPPRSILTWEDLVSKFINQFFPSSKTTYLRNEITNFLQKSNETFNEAWERFKDLL